MKKTFFIAFILVAFLSCEKGEILKGQFVFYDGAAVLQTDSIIYGVIINKQLEKLAKQAEEFKKEPTDMVQIEIMGKVTNQKDDKILWENKVKIIEILDVKSVSEENGNVVNLGKE